MSEVAMRKMEENGNKTERNLTRYSVFSLRISPDFISVANAGGGPVVEANVDKLDLVQDAGDDAAHARDGHLVAAL